MPQPSAVHTRLHLLDMHTTGSVERHWLVDVMRPCEDTKLRQGVMSMPMSICTPAARCVVSCHTRYCCSAPSRAESTVHTCIKYYIDRVCVYKCLKTRVQGSVRAVCACACALCQCRLIGNEIFIISNATATRRYAAPTAPPAAAGSTQHPAPRNIKIFSCGRR